MYTIISCTQIKSSSANIDIPFPAVVFIAGMNTVILCIYCKCSIFNANRIICFDTLSYCCHIISSTGEHQIIIAYDAMLIPCIYRKRAGPVKSQITFTVYNTICIYIRICLHIFCPCIRKCIFCSVCKCDKYFICPCN